MDGFTAFPKSASLTRPPTRRDDSWALRRERNATTHSPAIVISATSSDPHRTAPWMSTSDPMATTPR